MMVRMIQRVGSALVLALCLAACGPSSDDDAAAKGGAGGSGGTASGGTAGARPGSGGSSGAGTSSAGSATAAGRGGGSGGSSGTSAAGASSAADCTGTFGTPTPVFSVPGHSIGSLTLGPGELELIYVQSTSANQPNGENSYQRSVRTNRDVPFAAGSPLPELDAACSDASELRTGDISADGLRYYFVCYLTDGAGPFDLRRAVRASLDAPFVVDTATFGSVYTGITIAPDELELIDSGSLSDAATRGYRRKSVDVPFGAPTILDGLDNLFTPELASDDRTLFAAKSSTGTEPPELVVAVRTDASAPFGAPTPVVVDPDPTTVAVGSAAISGDCRSLYYVRVTRDAAASTTTSTLMLALR